MPAQLSVPQINNASASAEVPNIRSVSQGDRSAALQIQGIGTRLDVVA